MGNSDKDFEKSNQCAFDAYCKVILRSRQTGISNSNGISWKTVCISLCAIRAYTMRS